MSEALELPLFGPFSTWAVAMLAVFSALTAVWYPYYYASSVCLTEEFIDRKQWVRRHKNDDFDAAAKRIRVPKKWKSFGQSTKYIRSKRGLPHSTPIKSITPQPNRSLPLDRYDLRSGTKLCLVFNHEEFQKRKLFDGIPSSWSQAKRLFNGAPPTRNGTNLDVAKIHEVFGQACGFRVEPYDNLKKDEICSVLSNQRMREDLSCIAIFFLSHGDNKGNLEAFDQKINIMETITPALLPEQCPHLMGKAKMVNFYSRTGF